MKASTQYNDFIGNAAADISDHRDLNDFLITQEINTEKYSPIGADFYYHYPDIFRCAIICIDSEISTKIEPYIVKINIDLSIEEFFNLFKRFNVTITKQFGGYQNHEIDEEI